MGLCGLFECEMQFSHLSGLEVGSLSNGVYEHKSCTFLVKHLVIGVATLSAKYTES